MIRHLDSFNKLIANLMNLDEDIKAISNPPGQRGIGKKIAGFDTKIVSNRGLGQMACGPQPTIPHPPGQQAGHNHPANQPDSQPKLQLLAQLCPANDDTWHKCFYPTLNITFSFNNQICPLNYLPTIALN